MDGYTGNVRVEEQGSSIVFTPLPMYFLDGLHGNALPLTSVEEAILIKEAARSPVTCKNALQECLHCFTTTESLPMSVNLRGLQTLYPRNPAPRT